MVGISGSVPIQYAHQQKVINFVKNKRIRTLTPEEVEGMSLGWAKQGTTKTRERKREPKRKEVEGKNMLVLSFQKNVGLFKVTGPADRLIHD